MLPFVTSQVITHGQAKQIAGQQHARNHAKGTRKSLLSRVFEAIAESRMRHAETVLARCRRTYVDMSKK